MHISTKKINTYTTEITIDDKKYIITNHKISTAINTIESTILKFGKVLVGILLFISILRILNVVGHADFIAETYTLDDWTIYEYIFKLISGLFIAGIAHKLYRYCK